VKKQLAAAKRSSFPNVEKCLMAAKHFLVHFKENSWQLQSASKVIFLKNA
jgi:hypothetical protein